LVIRYPQRITKLPKNNSMKKTILFSILTCFIADFQVFSQANANQFKWTNGSDVISQQSFYGASTNGPGTRYQSVQWELNGKLYLFGGVGRIPNGNTYLNDLWVYDPATNNWTWLKGYNGTTVPNSTGSYGTIGVPSSTNLPSRREGAMAWTLNNKLYLMGGQTSSDSYNDLWEYDPITNNWTWIKGSNTFNGAGNYGTIGVETSTNVPGARYSSGNWVANGKLYLLGGTGTINGSNFSSLNDLWSYNPATNNWTYIKGSMTSNPVGTYGTIGVAASGNTPGGCVAGNSWTYNNKLYFMGGAGTGGAFNDLWSFDVSTNNWTWLKGSNTLDPVANFGSLGVSNSANVPGAKRNSSTWTYNGKLYLFGASSFVINVTQNDLWEYNPATNNWTWLKGDNSAYVQGQYGSMGITTNTNMPGGRYAGSSWVYNNKLYLFGGSGKASSITSGYLNDLWEYDPTTNNFTWIKGRNVIDKSGIYDAPLKPGARSGGLSWDYNNKLYLMGGFGTDENGEYGSMNDLWEYNPATNVWAWHKGSKFAGSMGSFGTFGVSAATNLPRARQHSATWTYNNKLYLFGGRFYGTSSIFFSSDTWVFDLSTNNWTWINGPIISDVFGIYGTMGVENAVNFPGSRDGSSAWTYNNKLYLFGGFGKGISGGIGVLNDLWEFNPATNNWFWASGPNTINASTITTGSPSTIRPGSRSQAVGFIDNDNAYIMGGDGTDVNGFYGSLNDLWKYNMTTKLFTFMKGTTLRNQFGVYGTQGVVNNLNKPGGRSLANVWVYNKKFYVSGGYGYASSGVLAYLNDMWEYKPSINNWTWLKGSFAADQGGVYGTQGVYNTSNIAGARAASSSFSANNKLYLFGGYGYGSGVGAGYLNDLWEYTPACTETYSVASGNWNTTSTWSCNQVPITTDVVNLYGHTVNLIGNGFAKNVIYNQNGNIQFGVLGKLFLNQ
jgi:N-acetylneuraminic acid mutarotase